jgi:hypothetical protein
MLNFVMLNDKNKPFMLNLVILNVTNKTFMLNIANKLFILNVVMLNVAMLNVVMLSVVVTIFHLFLLTKNLSDKTKSKQSKD